MTIAGVGTAALGYYGVSRASLELVDAQSAVAVAWPASGLALALFVMLPRTAWVRLFGAILLSNLVAQYGARSGFTASTVLAALNALEPVLGAVVYRRVMGAGARPAEDGQVAAALREVGALLAAASLAVGPIALGGALAVHGFFGGAFLPALTTWWLADGLGMLMVAPVVLALAAGGKFGGRGIAALLLVQSLVCVLIFWHPFSGGGGPIFEFPFGVLPVLLWIAIVGRPRATGAAIILTGLIISLATGKGYGPFARPELSDLQRIVGMQAFLATAVVTALLVGTIAAQRRRAEAKLAASVDRFSGVLGAATEFSVIGTDVDGTITVFNEGAERMLGYSAQDMVGVHTPALFHHGPEVVERAQELGIEPGFEVFVLAAREGRAETRDWTYVRADGSHVPVQLTVTAIINAAGTATGFIGVAQDVTETRATQAALRASVAQHRALMQGMPDASVVLYDRELRCVMAEGPLLVDGGFVPEEMIGKTLAELSPDSVDKLEPLLRGALDGETGEHGWESERTGRFFELEMVPFEPEPGTIAGAYVVMRNRTLQHQQQKQIEEARADLRTMFENAPIGNVVLDRSGTLRDFNSAFASITGESVEALEGHSLLEFVHQEDRGATKAALGAVLGGSQMRASAELRVVRTSGEVVQLSMEAAPLAADRDGPRALVQLVDITERRTHEDRLRFLADHDPLTGLLNRRRFVEQLSQHAALVERYGPRGSLIMLDIDHFKQVNDTLGHHAGDELIVAVATALGSRLRETDLLARLGGDEFAILLPASGRHEAGAVAGMMVELVRSEAARFDDERRRGVSISVGVAVLGEEPGKLTAESALISADRGMYQAKAAGRNGYAFSTPEVADSPDGTAPLRRLGS